MEMEVFTIAPHAVRIKLTGRLDMAGSARIDLGFNAMAGANRGIVVDLSAVTFLASIGIRTLVMGAKTVQRRGGKLILLNPSPDVRQVLEITGITDLMPIMDDQDAAAAAVTA